MKCGGKYVEMTQTSQSTQNQAQTISKTDPKMIQKVIRNGSNNDPNFMQY